MKIPCSRSSVGVVDSQEGGEDAAEAEVGGHEDREGRGRDPEPRDRLERERAEARHEVALELHELPDRVLRLTRRARRVLDLDLGHLARERIREGRNEARHLARASHALRDGTS